MNLKDLTLSNIKDFIQGYSRWFIQNSLPEHTKEQILYRASQCPKECAITGNCNYCSCDYPAKLFINYSCNKEKDLPPLMSEEKWNLYKEKLKKDKNEKTP